MKQRVALCCCGHVWEDHIYRTVEPGSGTSCAKCTCKMYTDKLISHRRAASKQTREAGPKAEIIKLLEAKGIRHWRMQSGDIIQQLGGRRQRIIGNKKSTPDILCLFKKFEFILPTWIECKSSSGKQSHEQVEFQVEAEANGETYLLIHSSEELEAWLEDNR